MAIHLSSPVSALPGIGAIAAKDLKSLGISCVRDLLMYVPFRYDDYSTHKSIGDLQADDVVTITGQIDMIEARPAGRNKKMILVEAIVADETGEIKIVWFNQPWLTKQLRAGRRISLAGRVDSKFGITMASPVWEPEGQQEVTGRLIPVYGLSGTLSMGRLRSAMANAMVAVDELIDWVPSSILAEEQFPTWANALRSVHAPVDKPSLALAIERLKFNELFLHQMLFAEVRRDRTKRSCFSIPIDEESLKHFVAGLPFPLTQAQRKACWEVIQDLSKDLPMNRLLEGDVGSGKTVVAAMAMSRVLEEGKRVIYLAPTELLADQQQRALQRFLPSHAIGLLTRSRARIGNDSVTRKEVEQGKVSCVVGTHAILQDSFAMQDLALVIVDEQHRFGVKQRHALLEREGKQAPHLLSMSATPIPRSLALTLYGDLDLSILDEMPVGRKQVATAMVPDEQREGMWQHVLEQISQGRQVFVVCPLIDPSDTSGSDSVVEIKKMLKQGPLKMCSIELLHGKLKADEKEAIMERFRVGEIQVLVATTVVEVGVDVPNATVMVIFGAERFGLAQLHQLRGRVGRSDHQSYCYLLPGAVMGTAMDRLKALESTANGFELAEKDLQFRGPGNVFGDAQSGFPDFQLATPADVELMKKARDYAADLLQKDERLEAHPMIREMLQQVNDAIHLE